MNAVFLRTSDPAYVCDARHQSVCTSFLSPHILNIPCSEDYDPCAWGPPWGLVVFGHRSNRLPMLADSEQLGNDGGGVRDLHAERKRKCTLLAVLRNHC